MAITIDRIADEMFEMVKEAQEVGKKLKPMDLQKTIKNKYDDVDKPMTKKAIKQLVDSGRLVYSYFGGTFLELPHREGAAND
ncbi:MAG: hypothetical protein MAG453_01453 [Calditrichaeota bacterium]|nr:hypothetical protein [Calditrichota bacterium]